MACSHEYHAAIKAELGRVYELCDHIGVQHVEGMPSLLLANCKKCKSTLSVPLPEETNNE